MGQLCNIRRLLVVDPYPSSIECQVNRKTPYVQSFNGWTSLLSIEVPEEESERFELAHSNLRTFISLVNLYLPPSQEVSHEFLNEPIPEDLQLAKVAKNCGGLVAKLHHRFQGHSLHRVCYFHSYHSTEDTMQRIRDLLIDNPRALFQTDAFGMTPCHILALAQKTTAASWI